MDYQQTIEFLYHQLPIFQRQGKSAYKANLNNTHAFDAYLNHPHQKFKTVHVAGTNGKGSVSHMLASVLQEAGYKTGLHTSPHLLDMRERVKVNGKMMTQDFVVDFVKGHRRFIEELKPSFFELMVMMAFAYFEQQHIDVALVEVGMGGRLDSTNVVQPEVSVITNIGFDHVQFLGDSLAAIAGEKAGIIKQGVPVVIGESLHETRTVFDQMAKRLGAPIVYAEDCYGILSSEVKSGLRKVSLQQEHQQLMLATDLLGTYQQKNMRTALVSLYELRKAGFRISDRHIRDGFAAVCENTGLMGRWQIFRQEPLVVLDTAHNNEGLSYIVDQILKTEYDKLLLVIGMVSEKDAKLLLSKFPQNAHYYLCEPNIPRAMPIGELENAAQHLGLQYDVIKKVDNAAKVAIAKASGNDMVYIGGSTFVVAEALSGLNEKQKP